MITSPSAYVRTTMSNLPDEERRVAQERLERWVETRGIRPYTGHGWGCLSKLANPRHRCGRDCSCGWPRVLDHPEWWVGAGGEFIVTAHPYGLGDESQRELVHLAETYGVRAEIHPQGSWYVPGATVLVVLWGRNSHPPTPYRRAFPRLGVREALAQAEQCGYIIASRGQANLSNRWWHLCEVARRPYVRITPRRTWAAIELDMEPAGRRLSELEVQRVRAAIREFNNPKGWYSRGQSFTYLAKVPVEVARAAASALLAVVREND